VTAKLTQLDFSVYAVSRAAGKTSTTRSSIYQASRTRTATPVALQPPVLAIGTLYGGPKFVIEFRVAITVVQDAIAVYCTVPALQIDTTAVV